jgi:hypothetical protein
MRAKKVCTDFLVSVALLGSLVAAGGYKQMWVTNYRVSNVG